MKNIFLWCAIGYAFFHSFSASAVGSCASITVGPLHNTGNCGNEVVWCNVFSDGILLEGPDNIATVPPGSTSTPFLFTKCAPSGQHTITFKLWTVTSGFVGAGNSKTNAFNNGDTVSGTLDSTIACTDNCLSTNNVYSWNVSNQGNAPALFWVSLDGVRVCGTFNIGGGTGMGMQLSPGQSGTLTTPPELVGCGGSDGAYVLYQVDVAGSWNDGGNCSSPNGQNLGGPYSPTTITPAGGGSGGTTTTGGGTGATGGGAGSGTGGTMYNPTNTSPITWNPTNSPGSSNPPTDGTMQEGFSALYDAINRNGAAIASGVAGVQNELISHRAIFNGISNNLGLISLAFGNTTNILIQETNLLSQVTNRLALDSLINSNGLTGVSNSIVSENNNLTNWLGQELGTNILNSRMLSNVVQGVSNAVVWSGTNQGLFLSNAFYGVMQGIATNGGFGAGGSGTNSFDVAGVTNNATANMRVLSNGLSSISGALSNGFAGLTNGAGYSNLVTGGMIPSSGTNGDAALASGNSASAAAQSAADGAIAAVGSPPQPGDGSMPSLNITIAGATMDISPEAIAPGITASLKSMITLVALITFAMSAGKLFWEASRTYAQAQTGGVPDLDAEVLGVGGNVFGVIAAIAVPTVFIGLWVALFTALFGLLTGFLSQLATSAFSLPNATAMAMLEAVFPLNLILSLVWTRVVMQFSAAKLVIISASASRYLFGK